jgi:hypothetical protein
MSCLVQNPTNILLDKWERKKQTPTSPQAYKKGHLDCQVKKTPKVQFRKTKRLQNE